MIARRIRNDDDVLECVSSATRMMSAEVTAFAAVCDRTCAAQDGEERAIAKEASCTASWTSANVRA
jgi:hypothetical protein